MKPLILTAHLDEASHSYFTQLRVQHFPSERNYLDAHLTLFHALPGTEVEALEAQLLGLSKQQACMVGQVTGLRSLGRGVAFTVGCSSLLVLRNQLAQDWAPLLTPQDKQAWKPHITVQNKVAPEAAKALLAQLTAEFQPRPVRIGGLDLYRYEDGPWTLARSFQFNAGLAETGSA